MTWPISAGSKRARRSASCAARTARSVADVSAKEPLYSAMGVRAPSATTTESEAMGPPGGGRVDCPPDAPRFYRGARGENPSHGARSERRDELVEAAPERVHLDLARVGVKTVREEHRD